MWKKKRLKVVIAMEQKLEALQWLGKGSSVQKVEGELEEKKKLNLEVMFCQSFKWKPEKDRKKDEQTKVCE